MFNPGNEIWTLDGCFSDWGGRGSHTRGGVTVGYARGEKGRPNDLCMVLHHGTRDRGNEIYGKVWPDDFQPRGHPRFFPGNGVDEGKRPHHRVPRQGGEDRSAGERVASVEGERYGEGEDVEWSILEFGEHGGRRHGAKDKSVRPVDGDEHRQEGRFHQKFRQRKSVSRFFAVKLQIFDPSSRDDWDGYDDAAISNSLFRKIVQGFYEVKRTYVSVWPIISTADR